MLSRSFRSAAGGGFLFAVTSAAALWTAASVANGASAVNASKAAFKQSADRSNYNLTGTVVNSVTGAPIRSALVQISFTRQLSTLTGSDGKFRFEGLPSGQTAVSVRKPGFFSEEEIHSLTNSQRMFSTGPDSAPVVLKLIPEGVIFGTIRGEEGEPLEGMNVRLMRNSSSSGRKRREAQGTVQTDETGAFRFAELIPGMYFLSVSQGDPSAAGLRGRIIQPSAKGYPTEFYPGVPVATEASPIKIIPGERKQLDMLLTAKPFYRVGGAVSGYAAGQNVGLQITDASGQPLAVESNFNSQTGRFQIVGIPPGTYTIAAAMVGPSGSPALARKQVIVNSDVSNVQLRLAGTISIPVIMRTEFSTATPPENGFPRQLAATVVLAPVDASSGGDHSITRPSGTPEDMTFEINGVQPGTYSVRLEPAQNAYIYSAKYGSIDLLHEDLSVDSDTPVQTIEVILRDDSAQLSGALTQDGRKAAGAVLLIPENAPRLMKLMPTDSLGAFEFSVLAPGNYKVLGMDRMDDVEYGDPEFLRKYLPNAQEISLSARQAVAIQVELVHVGD
jgi:hypothetical protein